MRDHRWAWMAVGVNLSWWLICVVAAFIHSSVGWMAWSYAPAAIIALNLYIALTEAP